MASKKVTVTKAYIDSLKTERDSLKKELNETKSDLDKHRNFWTWLHREVVMIHGQGKAVSSSWLIEAMAKHFMRVKQWYWG